MRHKALMATLLVTVGLLVVAPAASGNAGPVGLPPQPGHWRLTGSTAARGIAKRFQAKSGSFVLRRSGNQRFVVSKLRMTLPGDLPHGSPCWQNSPLKVLGTFTATRSRNGEYVLWLIDSPARFVLNGEERTGRLEMAFQRGIPGGYYRGETHPVVLGVEVPYGNEGLACAYNSAGRPAGRSSTPVGHTLQDGNLKGELFPLSLGGLEAADMPKVDFGIAALCQVAPCINDVVVSPVAEHASGSLFV